MVEVAPEVTVQDVVDEVSETGKNVSDAIDKGASAMADQLNSNKK